jgi:hypothetical protein
MLGGGIKNALPWGFYGRVLLMSGLIGLAVWFGVAYFVHARPGIRLGVGVGAFVALFVPIGRAVGLVEKGDLRYMGQWLTLQMLKKEPAEVVDPSETRGP